MSLRPKQVDFDLLWGSILATVRKVIVGERVEKAEWNDRFSDVYSICVCYPEPLGDKLYLVTKAFIESHVQEKYEVLRSATDERLLSTYNSLWESYSNACYFLDNLYGYLNSQYIRKQRVSEADMNYGGVMYEPSEQLYEIGELGLDIWKRLLVEPLKNSLVSLCISELHKDRCSGNVNQAVLHGVIISFVNMEKYKVKNGMKYYEDTFETMFLKKTGEFYRSESQKLIDQTTCSDYMERALQQLDDENLRSRKFLSSTSYAKVTHELQQRLVADHLQMLHDECRELVQKEKRHDLGNMYRLLHPIHGGLTVLVQEVETHIKNTALNSVTNIEGENMAAQFVESMLDIHSKFSELIRSVFCSDQLFIGALDRACSSAINYRVNVKSPCRAPDLLARYCDGLLKKNVKSMSETEADDKLNASITVFKYLDDKDIFNRFYARMLARRLIYAQSHSMDAEEGMINRLKQACGYEFTNKLHRMFTDMAISSDLQSKFSSFLKQDPTQSDLGVNFSILVLQAGAWPVDSSNMPRFALPQELERSVQTSIYFTNPEAQKQHTEKQAHKFVKKFELFYMKNFNGRKLTWVHNFCHAEVKFNYLKRPYFVTMGTYLMSLLLPFNTTMTASFRELLDCTQLQSKDLTRHAQLLVDSKILDINTEEVTEESSFSLNMNYNNKRNKFRMLATQKESPHETEQTRNAVDEDRKLFLQAAIVRVMKARRVLKHNLLIQEVLSQSQARFAPSIPLIKKCIEALIDKQYIERTPGTTDEYSYVA